MRISDWSSEVCSSDLIAVTGESIEIDAITGNSLVMDGFECVGVDTTDTAATETIYALTVEGNEFDVDSSAAMTATWRFFRLQNVRNASVRNNQWYGGGTLSGLVELISSNVTGNDGNYYYSLNGYLYDPDTASTIRSEEHTSELQSLMRITSDVFF